LETRAYDAVIKMGVSMKNGFSLLENFIEFLRRVLKFFLFKLFRFSIKFIRVITESAKKLPTKSIDGFAIFLEKHSFNLNLMKSRNFVNFIANILFSILQNSRVFIPLIPKTL
jgi:hypothetical protein